MANWNKPDNNSLYTAYSTEVNDKFSSLAKQNYGTDTNIPTGAIRFNETTKAWEKWSGSVWAERAGTERALRPIATTAGTQPTYTLTNTVPWLSYVAGDIFMINIHSANTGSATINVDGLGARTFKWMGNNLVGGELTAKHLVYYDGTDMILLNRGGGWATWTPTYSGSGSLTFTSVTTNIGYYQRNGNRVDYILNATGTIGGTTSNEIRFTPPVAAGGANGGFGFGDVVDAGAAKGCFLQGGSPFAVRKYDGSNYTLGAGIIQISGFYYV